jgi:hypothetical protein
VEAAEVDEELSVLELEQNDPRRLSHDEVDAGGAEESEEEGGKRPHRIPSQSSSLACKSVGWSRFQVKDRRAWEFFHDERDAVTG